MPKASFDAEANSTVVVFIYASIDFLDAGAKHKLSFQL